MAPPAYRYLALDLITEQVKEELPFRGVTYSQALNASGGFTGSIPVRHTKATRGTLDPGRTAIVVERDGVVAWAGILWAARARVEGDEANVELLAQGYWSYFRRRVIRDTLTFAQVDQLQIARDILQHVLDDPNTGIEIDLGTGTSGVLRDRTYGFWERKQAAEAVEQLAAVQNGFDFRVDVQYDPAGGLDKRLVLTFPATGRRTNVVIDTDQGANSIDWLIDAERMATRVTATGDGEDEATRISVGEDASAYPAYPVLEEVFEHQDVSVQSTLDAHAAADLADIRRPISVPSVVVDAARVVGRIIPGDDVRLRVDDGFVQIDERRRVLGYEVTVTDEGRETARVDFITLGGS